MPTADTIKREFDKQRLLALAHEEGLERSREGRMQCPHRCSDDKRGASVSEDPAGYAVWHCQRCKRGGSAIDLVQATRPGLDVPAAVAELAQRLHMLPAPPPTPIRVAVDVPFLWGRLQSTDPTGMAYLTGRGLGGAVAKGEVRFNTGASGHAWLDARAREGYRIAVPLYSSSGGAPYSLQLRSIDPACAPRDTKRSLAGVKYPPDSLVIGQAFKAKSAPVVFVAEGMADTLALLAAGVVAVGAPGQDQLRHALAHVGEAGPARLLILCPQNDPPRAPTQDQPEPPPTSQSSFQALAREAEAQGWTTATLHTPALHKDPAAWLQAAGLESFRAGVQAAIPPPAPAQPDLPGLPERPKVLRKSYASLLTILREDRRVLPGRLEWDEMLCTPTADGRELADSDTGKIRERIELLYPTKRGGLQFVRGDIEQAILQLASDHRRHPVREYLSVLQWDGVQRLHRVCAEVLGAEPSDLNLAMLRRWFISAVARGLDPGCKVDTVLILQGDQGIGKSTFFSTVAGPRWFSDERIDVEDVDSLLVMQGVWILEWAELAAMRRARDLEELKAFVSRRENRFRAPYGRLVLVRPRHTVIVGTTNQKEILNDPTGNRRWWVLPVTKVNLLLLTEWRAQLWAEAVHLFRAGEQWHLTEAESALLVTGQHDFEQRHPWEERVSDWLRENARVAVPHIVTTTNVLDVALRLPVAQWNKAHEMAIAKILKKLGWSQPDTETARVVVNGRRVRVWQPPAPDLTQPSPNPGWVGNQQSLPTG